MGGHQLDYRVWLAADAEWKNYLEEKNAKPVLGNYDKYTKDGPVGEKIETPDPNSEMPPDSQEIIDNVMKETPELIEETPKPEENVRTPEEQKELDGLNAEIRKINDVLDDRRRKDEITEDEYKEDQAKSIKELLKEKGIDVEGAEEFLTEYIVLAEGVTAYNFADHLETLMEDGQLTDFQMLADEINMVIELKEGFDAIKNKAFSISKEELIECLKTGNANGNEALEEILAFKAKLDNFQKFGILNSHPIFNVFEQDHEKMEAAYNQMRQQIFEDNYLAHQKSVQITEDGVAYNYIIDEREVIGIYIDKDGEKQDMFRMHKVKSTDLGWVKDDDGNKMFWVLDESKLDGPYITSNDNLVKFTGSSGQEVKLNFKELRAVGYSNRIQKASQEYLSSQYLNGNNPDVPWGVLGPGVREDVWQKAIEEKENGDSTLFEAINFMSEYNSSPYEDGSLSDLFINQELAIKGFEISAVSTYCNVGFEEILYIYDQFRDKALHKDMSTLGSFEFENNPRVPKLSLEYAGLLAHSGGFAFGWKPSAEGKPGHVNKISDAYYVYKGEEKTLVFEFSNIGENNGLKKNMKDSWGFDNFDINKVKLFEKSVSFFGFTPNWMNW